MHIGRVRLRLRLGLRPLRWHVADRLLTQRSLLIAAMPWTRWASSADSFLLTPFIAAAVVAAEPAWNGVAATTAESSTPLPVSAL